MLLLLIKERIIKPKRELRKRHNGYYLNRVRIYYNIQKKNIVLE